RLSLVVGCALLIGLLSFGTGPPRSYAQTPRNFPETGKSVAGRFLEYWNQNGGLAQQGYPISDEMQETSDTDGKTYTVQYFQRAVFERHPGNARPNDVLLSLLGVFYYDKKHASGQPPAPGVTPTVAPPPTPDKSGTLLFYKRDTGTAAVGHLYSDGTYRTIKEYNTFSKDWQFIVPI